LAAVGGQVEGEGLPGGVVGACPEGDGKDRAVGVEQEEILAVAGEEALGQDAVGEGLEDGAGRPFDKLRGRVGRPCDKLRGRVGRPCDKLRGRAGR